VAVWIPGFRPTKRQIRLGVIVSVRPWRCAYVLGGAYPFVGRGFLFEDDSDTGFPVVRFLFD
jgi:hypothetical protein